MHVLRIEHRVPDFDRWKQVFDSDPVDRKGSGVRGYRVMRAVDDPDSVLIDLTFDSATEAEAMHQKLQELWAGPAKAVAIEPRARIVEAVETQDL